MSLRSTAGLFLLATVTLAAPRSAASLEITLAPGFAENFIFLTARDGSFPSNEANLFSVVPTTGEASVSQGGASSSSSYALTPEGFRFVIAEHARPVGEGTEARTRSVIRFRVDTDVRYELSGHYRPRGGAGNDLAYLEASLLDRTAGFLFFNRQELRGAVTDDELVLGERRGPVVNDLSGSLTGRLQAGHEYTFIFDAFISGYPSQQSATGTGAVDLLFVPEPGTALLLGIGLLGLRARGPRWRWTGRAGK